MSDYYREYQYSRKHRRRFRRSNNGLIFGVCQGLSNYTGISVGLIRTVTLISLILTGFAPVGVIYLILAICIPTSD